MNPRFRRIAAASVLAATASLSGCLFNSKSDRIVEADAPRVAVSFETDGGLQSFQSSVRRRYARGAAVQSESDFAIPFVISVEERRVLSENAYYNAQVAKADVDANGLITDAEATAYVGSPCRRD